ncbi:MAG: bacteriocin fulvocin C-related protein [Gemmatimonadaceae bacterium]|nr:bacteriocin fulvocin C-related protein [Gemmatimonadaceae bacterium]
MRILGKEWARRVFADLGVSAPDQLVPTSSEDVGCTCSMKDDYCLTACTNAQPCTILTSACGTLWCEDCNGLCSES